MIKHGKYKERQRYLCLDCKHCTSNPRQRVPKKLPIVDMDKYNLTKELRGSGLTYQQIGEKFNLS
jgi:hypothetical protein